MSMTAYLLTAVGFVVIVVIVILVVDFYTRGRK